MARVRLLTCLAVSVAALAAVGSARAAVPDGFVGIASDELVDSSPHARRAALKAQAAAGVTTLRQYFDWARIERKPGRYAFRDYDGLVLDAAKRGIRVFPLLFNPPRFRSSRPRRHAHRGVYPPRRYADMASFAAAVAGRYGAGGTVWAGHPQLAGRAVRSWQIWNEPNLPVYWASGVNPSQYVRLAKTVGAAIKGVDPGAEIVTAGIPNSTLPGSMTFERFVTRMYEAGGKDAFDALAVHPYALSARGSLLALKLARRLMDRHGDSDGRIWITEIGWASGGPPSSFRVGSKGQATRIERLLRGLGVSRTRLGLSGVIYYKWRDTRLTRAIHNFWGHHTGLLTASGKRKRAYFAFRRAALALER
jgi:polysaccharide biosynthesis protein PslG